MSTLEKSTRIFVAGHAGLVGSAIVRCLKGANYYQILSCSRLNLDLSDQTAVRKFFCEERPEFVILAAARVGGIKANSAFPAEFIRTNLSIQSNVIHEAYNAGIRNLLFLGSSCIYPRECRQPMREVDLLSGPLEPTNRPYALAKIAGIEMCWAYNRQYGTRYFAVMPTNCYGPGDNYDLENSHVLPALIRKVHEAKEVGQESFTAWGTGEVFREFLYSDDLADACVHIMNLPREKLNFLFSNEYPPLINIGSGAELRIREITALVAQVIGFKGIIRWDKTKPDGAPKKLLDSSRINGLGWYPKTALEDGIKLAYKDFLQRFNKSP